MHRTKLAAAILISGALLLASCATTGATGGPSAGAVTFVPRPPKVGDVNVSTQTFVTKLRMDVKSGGQTLQTTTSESTRRRRLETTVMATSGNAVTAERLHFLESTEVTSADGRPGAPTMNPVNGKTYLARFVNGKVEITGAQGGTVSKAELKLVKDEVTDLGHPDAMMAFLSTHTFEKGKALKVPDDVVRLVFNMAPGDTVGPGGMTLVLDEVRQGKTGRVAVLGTSLSLEGSLDGGGRISTRFEGAFTVEVPSGRLIGAHFAGPVEMKGSFQKDGRTFELTGTGTMTADGSEVYR